jgi:hypothetical protein
MAMVAAVEGRIVEYLYLPESNAEGETGRTLRSESKRNLGNLAEASIFWRPMFLLNNAHRRISELASLKSNWDSYGAPSPDSIAVKNAVRILKLMQPIDLERVNIVPSAEGGIAFCFKRRDRYADIETSNDGTILGVSYVGMETPLLINVGSSEDSIKAGLEHVRAFIGT